MNIKKESVKPIYFESLDKNQETKDKTIEAITAVEKLTISKPGTTMLAPHKRSTFIINAVKPRVRIDKGRALNLQLQLQLPLLVLLCSLKE